MKTLKFALLVIVTSIILTGCQKGDTGPTGSAGQDGNANVDSKYYTVAAGSWSGSPFKAKDITINEITQDILDNGVVMVYQGGPTLWNAMPFSNQNEEWRFLIDVNRLRVVKLHGDGSVVSDPGTVTFKVVIISGDALLANPNLDLRNYEEVKSKLNLKD